LPARAPPRSPAQAFGLFQAAYFPIETGSARAPMIPFGLHSREPLKGVQISQRQPMYGANNPRETACAKPKTRAIDCSLGGRYSPV
jgi:hypothetical protein